jgi:hypothetical protein
MMLSMPSPSNPRPSSPLDDDGVCRSLAGVLFVSELQRQRHGHSMDDAYLCLAVSASKLEMSSERHGSRHGRLTLTYRSAVLDST